MVDKIAGAVAPAGTGAVSPGPDFASQLAQPQQKGAVFKSRQTGSAQPGAATNGTESARGSALPEPASRPDRSRAAAGLDAPRGASRATRPEAAPAARTQRPAAPTRPASTEAPRVRVATEPGAAEPTSAAGADRPGGTRLLRQVQMAQARLDQILKMAESGRTFSPAELIAFQAHTYRASQELEMASKVVEKGTSAVKQTLQTQI